MVNLQLPFKGETWQRSVELLGVSTTHIHIHNWTSEPEVSPLTYLCEGSFDWRPVLRALAVYGRRITLSIEHANHGGRHDPWETARRDGPWLASLRAELCQATG